MTTSQLPDEFPDEPTGDGDLDVAGVHAAANSLLASLRSRREKAVEQLHKDLEVPRLSPPVFVRFKPVEQAKVDAANKRALATKSKDATVNANAAVLAEACIGVFEVIDGVEVSIDPDDRDGAWPKFGPRLAALLGIPAGKAAEVVRGLYLTDGDVISTAGKLTEWSGYTTDQLERDEGN